MERLGSVGVWGGYWGARCGFGTGFGGRGGLRGFWGGAVGVNGALGQGSLLGRGACFTLGALMFFGVPPSQVGRCGPAPTSTPRPPCTSWAAPTAWQRTVSTGGGGVGVFLGAGGSEGPASHSLHLPNVQGTQSASAAILAPSCGSRTAGASRCCAAPRGAPTAAGAARCARGRCCWHRGCCCTAWGGVSPTEPPPPK